MAKRKRIGRDKFRCRFCKRVVPYTLRHLAMADGGNALGYSGTWCQFPKFKAKLIKKYGKNWRPLREAYVRQRRQVARRRPTTSSLLRRAITERNRLNKRIKELEAQLNARR
jgi:hypothetical protein